MLPLIGHPVHIRDICAIRGQIIPDGIRDHSSQVAKFVAKIR